MKPYSQQCSMSHLCTAVVSWDLKTELPGKWEYYIDRLSCHIASSGRKYKSHAATIFKWAQEDAAKKAPKKGIPDYTCKEGESL